MWKRYTGTKKFLPVIQGYCVVHLDISAVFPTGCAKKSVAPEHKWVILFSWIIACTVYRCADFYENVVARDVGVSVLRCYRPPGLSRRRVLAQVCAFVACVFLSWPGVRTSWFGGTTRCPPWMCGVHGELTQTPTEDPGIVKTGEASPTCLHPDESDVSCPTLALFASVGPRQWPDAWRPVSGWALLTPSPLVFLWPVQYPLPPPTRTSRV